MQVRHEAHLKLAFLIWGIVGVSLFTVGIIFLGRKDSGFDFFSGVLFLIGIAIGLIKGHFVLKKVARKNINRIYALPRESSFFSTFSLKSWIMVLVMILLGRSIRWLGAPYWVSGFIYVAVGFGLALSSRVYLSAEPGLQESSHAAR
jgi:hypothetical protein